MGRKAEQNRISKKTIFSLIGQSPFVLTHVRLELGWQ